MTIIKPKSKESKPIAYWGAIVDDRFCRIGRSLILNLKYIQRVTKTDVYLSDGTMPPLPRGAYEPLNRAIIQHT